MSRWSDQLENHPIWATAETIKEHLSVEIDDVSDELFSERRRVEQFVVRLLEILKNIDPEQIPFNRLDNLNKHLNQHVVNQTQAYSTSGDVQTLRNANDQLQNPVFELSILKLSSLPIGERSKVDELNKLADEFVSDIDRKRQENANRIAELDKKINDQSAKLKELSSQIKSKNTELNALISDWQNQFNDAQQSRQTEHNTAHQQRGKAAETLFKNIEQSTKERIDKLVSGKTEQLEIALEEINSKSTNLIDSTKEKLAGIISEGNKKRDEILHLHQLVANDSTTAGYAKNANDEKKQANFWRWISFSFIIATILWLSCVVFYSGVLEGNTLDITSYPIIVSLTGVLLFGAAYGATQSTSHRNNEKRNRWLALRMAAFEPFISSLNDEQKIELRAKVSEQLFNSEEQTTQLEDNSFKVIDQFVDAVTKILKARQE